MTELIGLKRCSTCQDAEKALKAKGIDYKYREIDVEPPTAEELLAWQKASGLPITRWLNTSGMKYRELNISEKRKTLSDKELLEIIATDGMLVKRPILFHDGSIYVGPDVKRFLDA